MAETTYDAEIDEKVEETAVSNFYRSHVPHVTESSIRRQELKKPNVP